MLGKSDGSKSADGNQLNTIIGLGTVFEGTMKVDNGVRIDGTFNGELQCSGALTISQSGQSRGNLWAKEVYINGRVDGDVHADKVRLDGDACLVGDVHAKALSVADGAVLHGVCNMQSEKGVNEVNSDGVDEE
tara:strand:+ start:8089 stop:8487 length:399 start_codon:yes stop_codon:yes gene_type:complete